MSFQGSALTFSPWVMNSPRTSRTNASRVKWGLLPSYVEAAAMRGSREQGAESREQENPIDKSRGFNIDTLCLGEKHSRHKSFFFSLNKFRGLYPFWEQGIFSYFPARVLPQRSLPLRSQEYNTGMALSQEYDTAEPNLNCSHLLPHDCLTIRADDVKQNSRTTTIDRSFLGLEFPCSRYAGS